MFPSACVWHRFCRGDTLDYEEPCLPCASVAYVSVETLNPKLLIQRHCWLDRRHGLDGADELMLSGYGALIYVDLTRAFVCCLRIHITSGWANAGWLNLELHLTGPGSS